MKGCVMGTLCGFVYATFSRESLKNCTFTPTLEIFHSYGMELNLKQSNLQTIFKKYPKQSGHCSPCPSRLNSLCCRQCKSESFIYLHQCHICQFHYHGPSKHSSWWRLLEDVLKASFVFVFKRRLQDVFKKSWSRQTYSS